LIITLHSPPTKRIQPTITRRLQPANSLPKLLIVEDNAEVRGYIKSVFLGRYLILEAGDGMEGLESRSKISPTLLLDVMMPVMMVLHYANSSNPT